MTRRPNQPANRSAGRGSGPASGRTSGKTPVRFERQRRAAPRAPEAAPPSETPPAPLDVRLLDNHLLVVVKPAGLLAQADRTGDADVLTLGKAFVKAHFGKPGEVFLGLVHRLDRPVSGLMVLARTSKAAARLSAQFRERTLVKTYVALVEGRLDARAVFEDFLLKTDETVRVVRAGTPGAKAARLRAEPLLYHDGRTLVGIHLDTGRAHQIRVQLAARGHALVGDRRYGAAAAWRGGRIALHSAALAFAHPTRPETVRVTAPPDWPAPFGPAAAAWLASQEPDDPESPGTVQGG